MPFLFSSHFWEYRCRILMRHMQLDIHNVLFMFSFFSVRISVLFQELGTDSFSQLLNVQVKICKDVSQATECGKLACFFLSN